MIRRHKLTKSTPNLTFLKIKSIFEFLKILLVLKMSFDFFSDSSVDYEGESEVEAYYDEYYGEGYYSEHMEDECDAYYEDTCWDEDADDYVGDDYYDDETWYEEEDQSFLEDAQDFVTENPMMMMGTGALALGGLAAHKVN